MCLLWFDFADSLFIIALKRCFYEHYLKKATIAPSTGMCCLQISKDGAAVRRVRTSVPYTNGGQNCSVRSKYKKIVVKCVFSVLPQSLWSASPIHSGAVGNGAVGKTSTRHQGRSLPCVKVGFGVRCFGLSGDVETSPPPPRGFVYSACSNPGRMRSSDIILHRSNQARRPGRIAAQPPVPRLQNLSC